MPQDKPFTDDEGSALPTTDELIALFSDTLPQSFLDSLRDLELDPLATYNEIWKELERCELDAEAIFTDKCLLEPVDQWVERLGFNPREPSHD